LLEQQLGVSLFERERNNIRLTPEGERLLNHARLMINGWENARYDVLAASGAAQQFSVLGVPSLWETLLLPLALRLRREQPQLNLKLESLPSELIWRKLQQGKADVGFLFEPHTGPELHVREARALDLTLVAPVDGVLSSEVVDRSYMMVDFGASFMTRHRALFPALSIPATLLSTGRVALDFLLAGGGSGCYLPAEMVTLALAGHQLFTVADAKAIELPVYAVYPVWSVHAGLIDSLILG
jgi:DNA-binding transcriptional LysR family regulator